MRKIEDLLNEGYYLELDEKMKNDKQFQKMIEKLITKKDEKHRSNNASFMNMSPS